MSNIFALAEDAKRRVEGRNCQYCNHSKSSDFSCRKIISEAEKETILLLVVLFLLYKAGANTILLLAILYVTL